MFIKTLTKRKIVLWVALLSIILVVLFSFLDTLELHNYTVKANKKYGKSAKIFEVSYVSSIMQLIFYGLFFLFSFLYIYSKGGERIRNRKWPYIVLIVFSIIMFVYKAYVVYKRFNGYYEAEENGLISQKMLDEDFKKEIVIKVYSIFGLVFSILLLLSLITSLVLIKKQKGEADIEYSKTILETGKNIEEGKTNAQQKNNLPNDLP